MRAPDAPIGWPSATAPPLTLTRVLVDAEHPHRRDHDRGERLVDLPQVDVATARARPSRARRAPQRRGAREVAEVLVGDLGGREDRRERLARRAPAPTRRWRRRSPPAPSLTPGRVAGRVRAVLDEDRRQLGERLERRVAPRRLVLLDDDLLCAARAPCTATISSAMPALVDRRDRALVRAHRPAVHLGARDLELRRDLGRLAPPCASRSMGSRGRRAASRRAPCASPSRTPKRTPLEQVRRVRHRLHAAAEPDLDVAGADRDVQQRRPRACPTRTPC